MIPVSIQSYTYIQSNHQLELTSSAWVCLRLNLIYCSTMLNRLHYGHTMLREPAFWLMHWLITYINHIGMQCGQRAAFALLHRPSVEPQPHLSYHMSCIFSLTQLFACCLAFLDVLKPSIFLVVYQCSKQIFISLGFCLLQLITHSNQFCTLLFYL